jgi:uncharacterized protein involved in outer membrane biogenesis
VKNRNRKIIIWVLGLFLLMPPLAYWALDSWLESSGGRRMLENTLSKRTGMDVKLQGAFDLMLLPDIGVSGTDLVVGGPAENDRFASSREYEISVALKPLLKGNVRIDWIRLTGGVIHPERYRSADESGSEDAQKGFQIPEIRELTIRDFEVVIPAQNEQVVEVNLLELKNFSAGQQAPFHLDIEGLAMAQGWIRWDVRKSRLDFGSLELRRQGQLLRGRGCLAVAESFAINLFLEGDQINLDRLRQDLPEFGGGGDAGMEDSPLDIKLRLEARELQLEGAVARGVVFSLGNEPSCD